MKMKKPCINQQQLAGSQWWTLVPRQGGASLGCPAICEQACHANGLKPLACRLATLEHLLQAAPLPHSTAHGSPAHSSRHMSPVGQTLRA